MKISKVKRYLREEKYNSQIYNKIKRENNTTTTTTTNNKIKCIKY